MKVLVLVLPLFTSLGSAQPARSAPLGASQAPGSSGITLTWTASVTGGVTYTAYRAIVAGGVPCPASLAGYMALAGGLAALTYIDTTAVDAGVYCYVVTASGAGLTSGPSNAASVTVSPQPPTGLAAAAN